MSTVATTEPETVLKFVDVRLSFGGIHALAGVDFALSAGEWRALIGPNGSGKTSSLNVLTGFYRAQQGQVLYRDAALIGKRAHHRHRVGIVRTFQHPVLSGRLSLLENVLIGADARRRSGRQRTVEIQEARRLLEELGCGPHAEHPAGEVPYGVRKRAEVARALIAQPALLLLDEPAAGLSQQERQETLDVFGRIRKTDPNLAAIVVEHDVRFVSELCETATALDFGTVIASGPTPDVLADPRVRAAFLGEA